MMMMMMMTTTTMIIVIMMLKDLKSRARIQQADAMRQLEVNALVGEVRCKSSLLSCKTNISNYSSLVQYAICLVARLPV
jgi:hypothetical protein